MADQVPPMVFVPVNAPYNNDAFTLEPAQINKLPFDPALAGTACSVTVTVAVLLPQGETPSCV